MRNSASLLIVFTPYSHFQPTHKRCVSSIKGSPCTRTHSTLSTLSTPAGHKQLSAHFLIMGSYAHVALDINFNNWVARVPLQLTGSSRDICRVCIRPRSVQHTYTLQCTLAPVMNVKAYALYATLNSPLHKAPSMHVQQHSVIPQTCREDPCPGAGNTSCWPAALTAMTTAIARLDDSQDGQSKLA